MLVTIGGLYQNIDGYQELLYIEETRFISLVPPFYSIQDVFKPDPN